MGKKKQQLAFVFLLLICLKISLERLAQTWSLSLSLLPILALAQWLGAILEVFQKLRGAVWVDAVNCPNSLNETICCSRRQSWQLNPIIKISLLYPQPHAGPPRPTP